MNRWCLAGIVNACLCSGLLLHLVHESVHCTSLLVVGLSVLGGLQQVTLHVLLLRQ